MAIGSNKTWMLVLEHESPSQESQPITAGGKTLKRGSKGKMQWKKADSDGVKRKVRGSALAAARSKKHKYDGSGKKKKGKK